MSRKIKVKEKLYEPDKIKRSLKPVSITEIAYRITNIDLLNRFIYLN